MSSAVPASPAYRERRGMLDVFRHRGGATAIEFAFIMPIFFFLLSTILEISLMLHSTVVVEGAVANAARMVRTGQAQQSGDALGSFQTQLCSSLYSILDCGDLTFDVRTFSDFASVTFGIEFDEDGNPINTTFSPGAEGDITVVSVVFQWSFFTPFVGKIFGDAAANTRQILSTAVFRNEPYD